MTVRVLVGCLVCLLLVTACGAPGPTGGADPRPPPTAPARPLLTVAHWQQLFDADAAATEEADLELSRSPDSWSLYTLAYSVDEFAAMFEATGDPRYADRALEFVENTMATARVSATMPTSTFRDGYRGWVSSQEQGQEVPLYESYCWRYVTRLLRTMRESPLFGDPAFRARYERILAFTETDVFDKWFTRGADAYVYRSRTHMAAHWAAIAVDLAELTTDPARRARYREVVANIDDGLPNQPSSLRGQLRPSAKDPAAYWWSDVWGATDGPAQDVSHGNAVVAYVVEAHDVGSGWNDADMARFGRTLTSFVLGEPGAHPDLVDGTGRGNGWLADGFVRLGRFDPAVQAALEDHDVQNAQFYAAMAVNAKRLGATGAP